MTATALASALGEGDAILTKRLAAGLFAFALLCRLGWIALAGGTALSYSDDAKAYFGSEVLRNARPADPLECE